MPPRTGGRSVWAVILAAGLGKRMRSKRIKLLHVIGGAPMVRHVARAAAELKPVILAAVVGNQAEDVASALSSDSRLRRAGLAFVGQARQLGTGHAVMQAEPLLRRAGRNAGEILILSGDVPLIRPSTLRALLKRHRSTGAAATVLTTIVEDPAGYGRIVRGAHRELISIVEDRDATPAQKKIREINSGLYCAASDALFPALKRTGRSNAQGEHYLPDIFPILRRKGLRVEAYEHSDAEEVLGVNDRTELAHAGKVLYLRRAEELMESGVTIIDPACTYVDPDVEVGKDSVIHPMARLEGHTRIGTGCVIGASAHIVDSVLGDGVIVRDLCVMTDAALGDAVVIGPFAHLRAGTVLGNGVHIGNFVEVKKSRLGKGSKANHLAYLGDAEIGERCNIGAGTITCNYDGVMKHPTILEDDVFIGSDTQLVAPVRVRRGAYVGAGSTITMEVPEDSLALSRVPQKVVKDWVKHRRQQAASPRAKEKG